MALSCYSNWETMDHNLNNSGMTQFYDQPSELTDALIGLSDPINFSIDSLFASPPNDLFNYIETTPTTNSSFISSFSDPSIISLPIDNFDFYRCPKRPRSCNDINFEANSYNIPFVEGNSYNREKKMKGGSLSAQSIVARERRKRIGEKTQELGRLIPGGNKMNTAEMFLAAFKYVKFLQAQVGIFDLVGSIQGAGVSSDVAEDMHKMLESSVIQEILYGEGRCIVPKEMFDVLAKDSVIRSSPFLRRDLDRFISSTWKKNLLEDESLEKKDCK